ENISLIEKRQTIRTPFLPQPISDDVIAELCSSPQVQYHSLHSSQGEVMRKLSLAAYEQQAHDKAKAEELGEWMTFSAKEEHEKMMGLTPQMMRMSRMEHLFFNLFLNKRSVSKKSFAKASVSKAKKQLEACSGYLLITSPHGDWKSWFNSGRLLERVWLKGTAYELAIHPMSQVLEETKYYTLLKSELNISGEIQMILRVGKVKALPERKKQRLEAGS
ncbi:MAG: nitroreductase family protein, partial [Mangrovibacterium sp.]